MDKIKLTPIYIEADDDVTSIIDKLLAERSKDVALVLPSNPSVARSLVNVKLIKGAAEESSKKFVLVTRDASVRAVAGSAGVMVSDSTSAQPHIPDEPEVSPAVEDFSDKDSENLTEDDQDTDDVEVEESSKGPRIRVPNFEAFRLRLALGVLLLAALPLFWWLAFRVMPEATVNITLNNQQLPLEIDLAITTSESDSDQISVRRLAQSDDLQTQVEATEEKNIGTKASGTMTISNCTGSAVTIESGTGFSSGDLTFIGQTSLSLDSGNFTVGGDCKSTGAHVGSINVVAIAAGDQYNVAARSYQIASVSGDVRASGSAMAGGRDETVLVLSQSDVDRAQLELQQQRDDDAARQALVSEAQSLGLYVIEDSFKIKEGEIVYSNEVGDETDKTTAEVTYDYSILAITEAELKSKLAAAITSLEPDKNVANDGLGSVIFVLEGQQLKIKTVATTGFVYSPDDIFDLIEGQPADKIAAELRQRQEVSVVEVSLSPFWVKSIPSDRSKVNITIFSSDE